MQRQLGSVALRTSNFKLQLDDEIRRKLMVSWTTAQSNPFKLVAQVEGILSSTMRHNPSGWDYVARLAVRKMQKRANRFFAEHGL